MERWIREHKVNFHSGNIYRRNRMLSHPDSILGEFFFIWGVYPWQSRDLNKPNGYFCVKLEHIAWIFLYIILKQKNMSAIHEYCYSCTKRKFSSKFENLKSLNFLNLLSKLFLLTVFDYGGKDVRTAKTCIHVLLYCYRSIQRSNSPV